MRSSRPDNARLADRRGDNHDRVVRFRFNGRNLEGLEGDTLASALLANGIHWVGRSFKYHRPRGIFSAGAEEPNALVQVGDDPALTEPNLRATQVEIHEGLNARSQNVQPSLQFDLQAINDLFWRLMPAGFYYKTFMAPARWWALYEHMIRRAAGMGEAPAAPDPDRYDHRHEHCDLLIVGGGPAGLVAAQIAGRAGARVILADEQDRFGGHLLSEPGCRQWIDRQVSALEAMDNVTALTRATVFGAYHDNFFGLVERVTEHLPPDRRPRFAPRQRFWQIRARQAIMATGMIERPLVFHLNDRPGIMLAGAVRRYLHRHGVLAGRRPIIATNNNSAWQTAFDLAEAGASPVTIVDTRHAPPDRLRERAEALGIEVLAGHSLTGTRGRRHIRSVTVRPMRANGELAATGSRRIRCDLLSVSGGWNPVIHLFSHRKGPLAFDEGLASFVPARPSVAGLHAVGGAAGHTRIGEVVADAASRTRQALAECGLDSAPFERPETPETATDTDTLDLEPIWELPTDAAPARTRAFVDLQNDVTAKDLALALNEGYTSVEHVKRYTTTGMGTDQGKTGNVTALGIVADHQQRAIPAIGLTTFRPPYTPVTIGALVGRNSGRFLAPVRKTPMHCWHERHGAAFEDVGQWKRPLCYPRPGEREHDAVQREARAVRTAVGMLDGSTLGKIDICGPDAAEFLNRIYTNAWKKLAVGRCRYGVMLGEDGMVMDDGVTARIADDHFHMTTTTGGAARVMAWLEEWHQTEWPELKLHMTSVTDQWAVASLAGPGAREVAARLVDDIDVGREAMPFMSWAAGHVCGGIPARIFRISFSGEPGFEFNVPSRYGLALWEQAMAAGSEFGITPYGTEVMHLLRAEKGFIIVGQDTDGTVTPHDLNMDWVVSGKKDFIGRRSLYRADMLRPDRKRLVGLTTDDPSIVLEEGAHVLAADASPTPPVPMLGHVTSSYYSPNLNRSIALGLVKGGLDRKGTRLVVDTGHDRVPVEVVDSVFFDPEGERLHA
ncbi:MAG: sarcosine oxidase subunit alpha family protein [Wenzhouxiangellaceae bacterium]